MLCVFGWFFFCYFITLILTFVLYNYFGEHYDIELLWYITIRVFLWKCCFVVTVYLDIWYIGHHSVLLVLLENESLWQRIFNENPNWLAITLEENKNCFRRLYYLSEIAWHCFKLKRRGFVFNIKIKVLIWILY